MPMPKDSPSAASPRGVVLIEGVVEAVLGGSRLEKREEVQMGGGLRL